MNFNIPKTSGSIASISSMMKPPKAPKIPKVSAFKMPKMPSSAGIPKIPGSGSGSGIHSPSSFKMKVNLGGYQKNNKKLVMKKILGGIKLK